MKTYYLGLTLNPDKTVATLQARSCLDCLSCELYKYYGKLQTTKRQLKLNKFGILKNLVLPYFPTVRKIIID
jgi:hypothetical protein